MKRFTILHENRISAGERLLWILILATALLLAVAIANTAAGGTAYVSLVGDFAAAGDQHNFSFDLTRPVGNSEVLRFQTFASGGGVNAAGDTINAPGIDSIVQLFDSLNASRGINDDYDTINHATDSLLSWPGFTPSPAGANTPLNPDPLSTGSYRLNLSEYGNDNPGDWALDLVGPDDAIVVTGDSPIGNSAIRILTAGNGAQVTFGGGYELNGGKSFTFQSGADFTVTGYLDIGNTTGGSLNVKNPGTTLTTNTVSTTYLDWGLGGATSSVTLSDHATANILANYINIAADASSIGLLTVESGADMTTNGLYLASAGGLGQIEVRGVGSTLTQNSGSTLTIGSATGLAGLLNLHDDAVFTSGTGVIEVNPTGQIRVNNATFYANGNLTVASTGAGLGGVILENEGQIESPDVSVGISTADGSVLINGYTPSFGLPATWNVIGSMRVGSQLYGESFVAVEQSGRLNVSNDLTLGGTDPIGFGRLTVQTNGQVTIGDTLLVADRGSVELLGSGITTRSFIVEVSGVFTHTDGTLTVDGGAFTMEAGVLYIDSGSGTGIPVIKLENSAVGSVRVLPGLLDGVVNVGWEGRGRLEILSSSSLTSNMGTIASTGSNHPNSNGYVLVQGNDSLWQLTGNDEWVTFPWEHSLIVGETGSGTLEILAGGHVVAEGHVLIGSRGGSMRGRGTVIVNGPDSLLRVIDDDFGPTAQLSVGVLSNSLASGVLTVSNNGRVEVEGPLVVEDAGSVTLTSGGEIHAGSLIRHAPGTFNWISGTVEITNSGLTLDSVTPHSVFGNALTLGAGKELILTSTDPYPPAQVLIVGKSGTGLMEVQAGGSLETHLGPHFSVGLDSGSNGTIKVNGSGANWTMQSAGYVGVHGVGRLEITAGGHVGFAEGWSNSVILGGGATGHGSALVAGEQSRWQIPYLRVGGWGHGELTVSGGGLVTGDSGSIAEPSPGDTNSGMVTITDNDSKWELSGPLSVGGYSAGAGGTGTLTIANGGQVTADSVKVWQPGTVELDDGGINTGSLELAGGTLRGVGDVSLLSGPLTNAGVVAPGLSAGVLNINGDYAQDTAGTLAIQLGGNLAYQYDRLQVNGSAALGGLLDISLIAPAGSTDVFVPSAGQTFEILTAAGGLGGTKFLGSNLPSLSSSDLQWHVLYDQNSVTLAVGILGDYNFDGIVDAADYVVWRDNLSGPDIPSVNPGADGDGDGDVDANDYGVWTAHFGRTTSGDSIISGNLDADAAVPEPAATRLVLVLCFCAATYCACSSRFFSNRSVRRANRR